MTGAVTCADCPVADRAVCASLDEADRAALARHGRRRKFKRGDVLVRADEPNLVAATLVSGAAKISTIDADGVERIVALVHAAGLLGQCFVPVSPHFVTALSDGEVCLFPRDRFEAAIDAHPELARRMLAETTRELGESRLLIDMIGKRDARARVAALLLAFARAASPAPCHDAVHFELPLTRGDMAQLLGLTIETVSRQIVALEKAGLIAREGQRGIAIRDADALAACVA
jgi:CRP/FNR family transcriptional regulator, anaerobic regulatory protein